MKISLSDLTAAHPSVAAAGTIPPAGRRVTISSTRLAVTAAGAAVAGSSVGLAYFLSRRPTAFFDAHHAKFRA